jgi:hypothetical protein
MTSSIQEALCGNVAVGQFHKQTMPAKKKKPGRVLGRDRPGFVGGVIGKFERFLISVLTQADKF